MRFAYQELMFLIVQLLLKFRVVPGPSTEIGEIKTEECCSTRTPVNGIFCKLQRL